MGPSILGHNSSPSVGLWDHNTSYLLPDNSGDGHRLKLDILTREKDEREIEVVSPKQFRIQLGKSD